MKKYEFWQSDRSVSALEIKGDPTERYAQLNEPNAILLYRKVFENDKDFQEFYNNFFFSGLKEKLELLYIPASKFYLNEYGCNLKKGDTLVLKSGFIQNIGYRHNDYTKKVGWKFTVVSGDVMYPEVIWLDSNKIGSQQKSFPVLEENLKRFEVLSMQ